MIAVAAVKGAGASEVRKERYSDEAQNIARTGEQMGFIRIPCSVNPSQPTVYVNAPVDAALAQRSSLRSIARLHGSDWFEGIVASTFGGSQCKHVGEGLAESGGSVPVADLAGRR